MNPPALDWAAVSWPPSRLGDAFTALVRHARLSTADTPLPNPASSPALSDLQHWVFWAADRLQCETVAAEIDFRHLPTELAAAYPALIRLPDDSYLTIVYAHPGKLTVLTPALTTRKISAAQLADVIREPLERSATAQFAQLLEEASIPPAKRARTIRLLLDEQAIGKRFDQCWILRSQGANTMGAGLAEAGVFQNGAALLVAHAGQFLLWLTAWALLGRISFSGRLDRGWLLAWALLLISLIPFQLATTWLQGLFAIRLGAWAKARLLRGSLHLAPDEMRQRGIGSFLGQVLEAESLETLAVTGAIAGLLATVDLALAMFLLGRWALVLAAWCALTLLFAWRFLRRYQTWTTTRLDMTQDLIESMVGHRTRLVQQPRAQWHTAEDDALARYFEKSQRMDRSAAWLLGVIPRGWLLVGLACLIPAVMSATAVNTQIAIFLGGVLLAYTALRKLAGAFADAAAGWVAFARIKPLLAAAGRPQQSGEAPSAQFIAPGQKLLEAGHLTFRYRATGSPALRGCSLLIRGGEKILLEGPSGGGKTTFASLLSGLRPPESGLLLINGLDQHTIGSSQWRRLVAAAPQFHENYILTETLAFNLLLGRDWPPSPADIAEAGALCRELGLADLLERMPSGLLQMVGEGGWQLSHGEKSRIYIARALLQRAALVILDESFAALDPENLKIALECTFKHASTLLVIAHP